VRHRRTVEGRQATKEMGQAITILYVTLPIMPPPYSLRFPFRLPSDRAIGCDTTPRLLGHLVIRIDDKTKPYYAFVIDGFSSEDEANQFIPKLWTGLRWLLMTNGIAVSAQRTLQTVTYVDDPVEAANNPAKSFGGSNETPVDCLIDGSRPAILDPSKNVRTITGNDVTLLISTPEAAVVAAVSDGVVAARATALEDDPKLSVALDLYSAFFSESSANARFLTLVMALEALTQEQQKEESALALLEKWKTEVSAAKVGIKPDSAQFASLEALDRELLFRKNDSIRSQFRRIVFDELRLSQDLDAAARAKRAVEIYDLRSRLVHDGHIDSEEMSQSITDIKAIVEDVMKGRFRRLVGM